VNRFFRKALLGKGSPYFAELPYNLGWALGDNDPLHGIGLAAPIVAVDVGCRGGLPDELWPIRKMVSHVGFEADPEECVRLSSEPHDYHSRSVHPVFVGGRDGKTDFHLYKGRALSSALLPDERYAQNFGGPQFSVDKTIEVTTTTLDTFFAGRAASSRPDFIKLDTQGTELEILRGAAACLKTCLMVEVEAEFVRAYRDQPLFGDIADFLSGEGFELLYLNRVFAQRRGFTARAKGQMTFGDALFVRRDDRLEGLGEEKLTRLAVLLINYGHLDIAQAVVRESALPAERKKFFET
jgi:FkbM family methyltransferase